MRLFTALWPPADVLDALEASVPGVHGLAGWRPIPRERWHVTLAFHGADDPDRRVAQLDALAGAAAPRLRFAGTGTFPGVLWTGLETADPEDAAALVALVAGAGTDPAGFVGHLTLARRSGRGHATSDTPDLLPGPWWSPDAVLLVASERDGDGLRYRPVHRVPLRRPRTGAAG